MYREQAVEKLWSKLKIFLFMCGLALVVLLLAVGSFIVAHFMPNGSNAEMGFAFAGILIIVIGALGLLMFYLDNEELIDALVNGQRSQKALKPGAWRED